MAALAERPTIGAASRRGDGSWGTAALARPSSRALPAQGVLLMASDSTDSAQPPVGVDKDKYVSEREVIAQEDARWYSADPPIAWFRKSFTNYGVPMPALDPYSRQLAPITEHSRVRDTGEALTQGILRASLLRFADFTVSLETDVVNEALKVVWRDRLGLPISERLRAEAGRTIVEESQHAYESDRIVRAFTGQEPGSLVLPTHPFLAYVDSAMASVPTELRVHVLLAAATTTETAITGTLDVIPQDPTVHPGVRAYMREHAIDEGRHFRLVLAIFRQWWPQLTVAQRDLIGPMFPKLFKTYLAPDLAALDTTLQGLGLSRRDASAILSDVYSEERIKQVTMTAGRHSLRAFKDLGLLNEYKDAFAAEGLW